MQNETVPHAPGPVRRRLHNTLFDSASAAYAEVERERIYGRILSTKADAKERGRYLGGRIPCGFTVEDGGMLEPQVEQQAIIA